jgi:hypothetical protein
MVCGIRLCIGSYPPGQVLETLPTEDHTTAVAWEPNKTAGGKAGYLWLGHWRTGLDVWQYDAEGKVIERWHIHRPSHHNYVEYLLDPWFVARSMRSREAQVGNYIQSLQPLKGGAMAVGCYGKGVEIITLPGQSKDAWRDVAKTAAQFAAVPHGARPPSERELTGALPALSSGTNGASDIHAPWAAPLRTDWATQGDWVARYGREYALLCAAHFDESFHIIAKNFVDNQYAEKVDAYCGPHHHEPFESLREWEVAADTNDRRGLYIPELGYRRITLWDDHGEVYPYTWQGPDIWLRIHLRAPGFTVSRFTCPTPTGTVVPIDSAIGPPRYSHCRRRKHPPFGSSL